MPRGPTGCLNRQGRVGAPDAYSGEVPNLKCSPSDTRERLKESGWARGDGVRKLPIAKTLVGVNMYLTPGGVREMHGHKEADGPSHSMAKKVA